MKKIQRALISVWRKTEVIGFAEQLRHHGIEIVSTGGTAQTLAAHGIPVTPVEQLTGAPEMLGGRVKTLHPRIHGGILARRDDATHLQEVAAHGLPLIEMVVVDLYPFEDVMASGTLSRDEMLEYIDIGGPAMLRSAAKNWPDVTVVCSPEQYADVLADLQQHDGATTTALRQRLALQTFQRTAAYDAAIAMYLQQESPEPFPHRLTLPLQHVRTLRYGENPHQRAALYASAQPRYPNLVTAQPLHGKELSFNNLADADAALLAVQEFAEPAVVIMKHQTPCGVAIGATLAAAYERAYDTDPDAASGGIISCNREVDAALAETIGERFLEVLIAPSFTPEALDILMRKKNRILLPWGAPPAAALPTAPQHSWRSITGGALLQEVDQSRIGKADVRIVTERPPTDAELSTLLFAWKVMKYVKSNAIVLARAGQTVGIGAGQMSRVDASRIAVMKARSGGHGCVAASDAFFPFRDGLDVVAAAGVTAVIQPGGSVRDKEVIAAANEHGMAMVFTCIRAFRH